MIFNWADMEVKDDKGPAFNLNTIGANDGEVIEGSTDVWWPKVKRPVSRRIGSAYHKNHQYQDNGVNRLRNLNNTVNMKRPNQSMGKRLKSGKIYNWPDSACVAQTSSAISDFQPTNSIHTGHANDGLIAFEEQKDPGEEHFPKPVSGEIQRELNHEPSNIYDYEIESATWVEARTAVTSNRLKDMGPTAPHTYKDDQALNQRMLYSETTIKHKAAQQQNFKIIFNEKKPESPSKIRDNKTNNESLDN